MKLYKLLAVLCALTTFLGLMLVGPARSQVAPQWGASTRGINQTMIVGGINPVDTTAVPFQFDAFGRLLQVDADRDRDYSLLTSLFQGVNLNASTAFQPNTPTYIGQYSRASLMLSWSYAAQADSDSTFIMVRIYGKTSPSSGNYYLWTPFSGLITTGDTCYCNKTVADSAGASGACITPPPSFVVTRAAVIPAAGWTKVVAGIYGGSATTRVTLRKIPNWALRFAGATGVEIPLVDQGGNPCPYPYIFVEVWNLGFTRNLTNVSAYIWPRVN